MEMDVLRREHLIVEDKWTFILRTWQIDTHQLALSNWRPSRRVKKTLEVQKTVMSITENFQLAGVMPKNPSSKSSIEQMREEKR